MVLALQNFTTLIRVQAAAVQARAATRLNLAKGSAILAILQANASVGLWMQWLILEVLRRTRLSTASGEDVDTFIEDFGAERLPAVAASGPATFSRVSPSAAAVVPVGALVRTADASVAFAVVADEAHALWNGSNGYTIPAGTAAAEITVACQTAGAAGNVAAGSISLISGAIPGVDEVTNQAAFTNGLAEESDDQVRARFPLWVASRARATEAAVRAALADVRQGLSVSVLENADPAGAFRPGHFTVFLDDGSGAPPADLVAEAAAAVEAVRALGVTYSVLGPSRLGAAVALTITTSDAAVKSALIGPVAEAVTAHIDGLGIGEALSATRIAAIAYGVSPSIRNVYAVAINGSAGDLAAGPGQVIRASVVVVN